MGRMRWTGSARVTVLGVLALCALTLPDCRNPVLETVKKVNEHYEATLVAPTTPGSLSVVAADSQLTVSWAPVLGASSYLAYWSTANDPRSIPSANVVTSTAASCVIPGLTNNRLYYVWVRAKNAKGESALSAIASGVPVLPSNAPPDQPAAPSVTPGDGSLSLAWIAVTGATSYDIFWSTSSDPAAVPESNTLNSIAPSAAITGLVNGTTYYVWLRARNRNGASSFSVSASGMPVPPAPAAPSSLDAIAGNRQVMLSWPAVSGATGYRLYWSTSGDTGSIPASNIVDIDGTDNTGWTLANLVNGTTYHMWVRARNLGGLGGFSPSATCVPLPPALDAPPKPVATIASGQVSLRWTADSDATGYIVNWSLEDRTSSIPSGNQKSVTDADCVIDGLDNGTTYYFWVRAVNSRYLSDYSPSVSGMPQVSLSPPPRPSSAPGLEAGNGLVTVKWAAVSGATTYEVDWSGVNDVARISNGKTVPKATLTTTIESLKNGEYCFVWVRASNDKGWSDFSDSASAIPLATPAAPVLEAGDGSLVATWSKAGGAESYDLYWNTMNDTSSIPLANTVNIANQTATVSGLANGTRYYVWLKGKNFSGTSEYSTVASGTPVGPPVLTTTAISNVTSTSASSGGNITSDGGLAVSARGVCWSTSPDPTTSDSASGAGSGTGTFSSGLTGLSPNTTYHVRAFATNSAGTAYGPETSFTTRLPAPSGVSLTGGTRLLAVSWTGVDGATAYDVYYATTNSAPLSANGPTDLSGCTTDIGPLADGTVYYVWIRAKNGQVTSDLSASRNVTTRPATPPRPVVAAVGYSSGSGKLHVSWNTVTGASGYDVYYDTTSSPPPSPNGPHDVIGTSCDITGLDNWIPYNVWILAKNGSGNSALSPMASGSPGIHVTGVSLDQSSCSTTVGNSVSLTWTISPPNATIQTLVWNSATPSVATVSDEGLVTGLSAGTSTIGITTTDQGFTDSCAVTVQGLPTLGATVIDSFSSGSATIVGNVTGDSGSPVTARGICWGVSANPAITGNKTSNGTGTGTFTGSLSGLSPGTLYYVRAYATNSVGTAYGTQATFTTPTTPTVTTTAVSNVTGSQATSGGNVTSDGGAPVTARGVCWSASTNPTTASSKTTDGLGTGIFTSTLTGLANGTTYYVRAYATNMEGTAYGNQVSFTTPNLPTVTTTTASSIGPTSAASGGTVTGDGGATVTARGVCWSTFAFPTTADNRTTDGSGLGTFTSSLTGLAEGTTYYYRAYATNSAGTCYGTQSTFSTPTRPTLTTALPTSVGSTSAACGGSISDDGGASVTSRGVCWSKSTNPTVLDSRTMDGVGTGSYTSSLSGLDAGTTYYVRAYAENIAGISYGIERAFTTLTLPSVTTTMVGGVTAYEADSGGYVSSDGGSTVTVRGVCWDTSPLPTIDKSRTMDGSGLWSYPSRLSGLSPWTFYFVRAYATNSVGTSYGNEVSFRTNALMPTVTTGSITSVGADGARGGGNVTDDGGAPVTARGLCWSSISNFPTTADNLTVEGDGTGSFVSDMTTLVYDTPYHVRAYATNIAGTAYGDVVDFRTNGYALGGPGPAGGTVYFDKSISSGGWRYLEVMPFDLSPGIVWAPVSTATGATLPGFGDGFTNTALIVSVLGSSGSYAALFCDTMQFGGYDDWYLPSEQELVRMYEYFGSSGFSAEYWSSNENPGDAGYACAIRFGGGVPIQYPKDTVVAVRAVRRF